MVSKDTTFSRRAANPYLFNWTGSTFNETSNRSGLEKWKESILHIRLQPNTSMVRMRLVAADAHGVFFEAACASRKPRTVVGE